ncbi:MAG: hypothetical protein GF401_20960 [Chitinivibrionales bacterium]|nr:hypothetical protein [Chitinivibrionales bacterium]
MAIVQDISIMFINKKLMLSLFPFILLLYISLLIFTCTTPTDPSERTENVRIEFNINTTNDSIAVGDTVDISLSILLPHLVSSLTFKFGSEWDTTISSELKDTLTFTHQTALYDSVLATLSAVLIDDKSLEKSRWVYIQGLAPHIVSQSEGLISIDEGVSCTLFIEASGSEAMKFKWHKDSVPVINGTNDTFIINSVNLSDAGLYYCIAENKWGKDTSSHQIIEVISPDAPPSPQNISFQKTEQGIILMWNAVVGVDGYYIFRDSAAYGSSDPFAQTSNSYFTINDPGKNFYWVKSYKGDLISSSSEYVSSRVSPPQWKTDTIKISGREGDSIRLSLSDTITDLDSRNSLIFNILNASGKSAIINDTLYLFEAENRDSGLYVEQIVADDGEFQDTVVIHITIAPATFDLSIDVIENGSIILEPSGGTYRWGDTVTVSIAPDSGYEFWEWQGDINGTVTPAMIIMTSDMTIGAQFIQTKDCRELSSGASINEAIVQASESSEILEKICPQPGKYENNTIEILGPVEIIIQK